MIYAICSGLLVEVNPPLGVSLALESDRFPTTLCEISKSHSAIC